jgi:Gram-negative bacterial TonB protein C-terminal
MASAEPEPQFRVSWHHPLQNADICIDAIPFGALTTRALRFAAKNAAAEIGGLLWGKTISGIDGKMILIQKADFSPSEDGLFDSSDSDLEHLSAGLANPPDGLAPIGYFRSSVRGDLLPREQDRVFIETNLTLPDAFLLILEPLVRSSYCSGHFFFKQEGRLQMQSSSLRVPLSPQTLYLEEDKPIAKRAPFSRRRKQGVARLAPGSARLQRTARDGRPLDRLNRAASAPPEVRNPRTHVSLPHPEMILAEGRDFSEQEESLRARSGWSSGGTLFLAALLVAGAGVSVYSIVESKANAPASESQTATAPNTPIGLQVQRRPDGQLELNWNRDFVRMAGRYNPRLSIIDGSYVRTLALTQDQLLSGKLAYFPKSDDILFHFEMSIDGDRTVGESIRVVSPEVYASSVQPGNAESSAEEIRTPSVPKKSVAAEVAPLTPPVRSETGTPSIVRTETPRTFVLTPKPPSDPAQRAPESPRKSSPPLRSPAGVITEAPPPISASKSRDSLVLSTQLVAPPPFKAPTPELPTRPAGTDVLTRQSSPGVMPTKQASVPTTEPAKPVYQVMPNTKPFGYSIVNGNVQVNVQVHVDENGTVREAEPLPLNGGYKSLLAAQALTAARLWRFKPAEVNGKRVPSTYIINFKFRSPQ